MNIVESYNKNEPLVCSVSDADAFPVQHAELRESPHFDLTIVARPNNRACDDSFALNEFDLGVTFDIPPGAYITIHGTHDLLRRGYCLPQTMIIARGIDHGDVRVFLEKKKEVQDLNLPYRGGLIGILHTCHYTRVKKGVRSTNNNNIQQQPLLPQHLQQPSYSSITLSGGGGGGGVHNRRIFE